MSEPVERSMARRERSARLARAALPALVFAIALLAMFWRVWTPIDGARRAFGWDAQWEYWGDLGFQVDAYLDGELPLWNPFDRTGYPFHADPQAGVLYPLNWLLVAVGALLGAAPFWLVTVKTLLHFWIAALGVHAFLRRRGATAAACYAGGFALVFSYPFIHNSFSALNWSFAWAPWALLAVDAWSERPSAAGAALIALALGLADLAGALAGFWYALLVVAPYAGWAIAHHARRAADRRAYLRAVAVGAAVALGIFAALVAAQTWATAALVPRTVRDVRDLGFIATTAFGADDLVGFAIPRFPGEGCYVGVAALLWATAAVSLRPTGRRLVLAAVAAAGVLCALGDGAPFLPFEASAVPAFGFFRRAHRYLYVAALPLAILAAEGLDELARLRGRVLRRRVALAAALLAGLVAAVCAIGFVVSAPGKHADASPYRDAYGFGLVAALAAGWLTMAIAWVRGRARPALVGAAAALLALDLALAQTPKLELNLRPPPATPRDALAAELAGVPREARVYDRELLGFRAGTRLHLRDLGGYEGDPLALQGYAELLAAAKRRPPLLGHAGVRWLLESSKARPRLAGPASGLAAADRVGVHEVPAVAPAAVWLDAATVVADRAAALAALERGVPGAIAAIETGALTAAERARATADGGRPPVAGRVLAASRGRLELAIDAPDDGVLVVVEAFDPGWVATVDGQPARIVPANLFARAVLLPAGAHRVVMEYRARGYLALAALVPLALLAIAALVLRQRRRRR